MNPTHTRKPDQKAILNAANILKKGGVVAFPTETVYGLGAVAINPVAVAKVFEIKKRPAFDPLIVHVATLDTIKSIVTALPPAAQLLLDQCTPGPLTLILPKHESIPDIVTAGLPTVAVRIPDHPVALELLHTLDLPVAAPSANRFGEISPTTAAHVADSFGVDSEGIDQSVVNMILDGGKCRTGVESTVLAFVDRNAKIIDTPILLRPGGTTVETIENIIGTVTIPYHNNLNSDTKAALSPGTLSRHYAPDIPLYLSNTFDTIDDQLFHNKSIGMISFGNPIKSILDRIQPDHIEILSKDQNLHEAAANLFAALRRLNEADIDMILAEKVPPKGIGYAINDRLQRASTPPP